jgi:hypothetical protein
VLAREQHERRTQPLAAREHDVAHGRRQRARLRHGRQAALELGVHERTDVGQVVLERVHGSRGTIDVTEASQQP